jgi:hypothetical protein
MPDGKMHLWVGGVLLLVCAYFNTKYNWCDLSTWTALDWAFLVGIWFVYSRVADIDQEGSKINDMINLALVGIIIWAFWTNEMAYGIAAAAFIGILQVANHRRWIHSIAFGIVISVPLYYIKPIFVVIAFVLFMSHLVADGEVSFFNEPDWW